MCTSSTGERLLHRLLRANHLTGWTINHWVKPPNLLPGHGACVDILFRKQKVAIEVDGYRFHSDRAAFEAGRRRRNELVLAGYLVLNVTWQQPVDDPRWVIGCIRRARAGRRVNIGRPEAHIRCPRRFRSTSGGRDTHRPQLA